MLDRKPDDSLIPLHLYFDWKPHFDYSVFQFVPFLPHNTLFSYFLFQLVLSFSFRLFAVLLEHHFVFVFFFLSAYSCYLPPHIITMFRPWLCGRGILTWRGTTPHTCLKTGVILEGVFSLVCVWVHLPPLFISNKFFRADLSEGLCTLLRCLPDQDLVTFFYLQRNDDDSSKDKKGPDIKQLSSLKSEWMVLFKDHYRKMVGISKKYVSSEKTPTQF